MHNLSRLVRISTLEHFPWCCYSCASNLCSAASLDFWQLPLTFRHSWNIFACVHTTLSEALVKFRLWTTQQNHRPGWRKVTIRNFVLSALKTCKSDVSKKRNRKKEKKKTCKPDPIGDLKPFQPFFDTSRYEMCFFPPFLDFLKHRRKNIGRTFHMSPAIGCAFSVAVDYMAIGLTQSFPQVNGVPGWFAASDSIRRRPNWFGCGIGWSEKNTVTYNICIQGLFVLPCGSWIYGLRPRSAHLLNFVVFFLLLLFLFSVEFFNPYSSSIQEKKKRILKEEPEQSSKKFG